MFFRLSRGERMKTHLFDKGRSPSLLGLGVFSGSSSGQILCMSVWGLGFRVFGEEYSGCIHGGLGRLGGAAAASRHTSRRESTIVAEEM